MLTSNTGRAFLRIILVTSVVLLSALSCNRGNTSNDSNDAGTGDPFVSDGGAGATIEIEAPDEIDTGDIEGFFVRLRDPRGAPLQFVRIFCESEQGIAIIEPSRAGVAFENTDANGNMSGQVGGLTPGSYLFECRASEGFNLIARVTIIIRGDAPPGFTGFPGAAGGNLGGGRLVEEPEPPAAPGAGVPEITRIEFGTVTSTAEEIQEIDILDDVNCDDDIATFDPEPFGPDTIVVTITNPLPEAVNIGTLTFRPGDGSGVVSVIQPSGTQIAAGETKTFSSFLTEVVSLGGPAPTNGPSATKVWAGTTTVIGLGTYAITVSTTVTGSETGDVYTLSDAGTIQVFNVQGCD